MRCLLTAAAACLLVGTAAAQPLLTLTPSPYDGSGDAPLVIRNVGSQLVSVDSLGFRSRYTSDSDFLGRSAELTRYLAGQSQTSYLICDYRNRPCMGDDGSPNLRISLAPGDSLTAVIFSYCAICRGGASGLSPDTLLLWRAGLPDPLEVEITGTRFVASEAVPGASVERVDVVPNPAADRGVVRFTVSRTAANATVALYDVLGRHIAVLHEGPLAAGPHDLVFDASSFAPGVYVVRASAGGLGRWAASARFAVVR